MILSCILTHTIRSLNAKNSFGLTTIYLLLRGKLLACCAHWSRTTLASLLRLLTNLSKKSLSVTTMMTGSRTLAVKLHMTKPKTRLRRWLISQIGRGARLAQGLLWVKSEPRILKLLSEIFSAVSGDLRFLSIYKDRFIYGVEREERRLAALGKSHEGDFCLTYDSDEE